MSLPPEAIHVALCTAPDATVAERMAHALVEERLVACANLLPNVRSIYRWEGRVEDDTEVLLVLKTRADRVAALADRVRELHPYDVPELIALPVAAGLDAYLRWVSQETRT